MASLQRSAGILHHITSLPGPYGIGDMGPEAIRFLDFMVKGGMAWWQILPLNPPGYGASPYQSWSAFAGNPLLINPDQMIEDGFLRHSDLASLSRLESTDRVDFEQAREVKQSLLRKAFAGFVPDDAYRAFCQAESGWLDDAALYKALSNHYDGRPWTEWEKDVSRREPEALRKVVGILRNEVEFQRFSQYIFFLQHVRLKREANERGVGLIGDIPIFVAHDSADVWTHQHLFHLDEEGEPTVVAGVPPDYFSKTGQRWGNPLYRWDVMRESGYRWWINRLQMNLRLYDIVRIDHFRGFEAYWEIPAVEKTAVGGKWVEGPGADFFERALNELDQPQILAEDLGDITPEVEMLRDQFNLPGMKVLQFGIGDPSSTHLPHNFLSPHTVVYTGTHDNNTTLGWWKDLDKRGKRFLREYSGKSSLGRTRRRDVVEEMIRLALSSTASIAIIPMQDILGLDSDARMNVPGAKSDTNWSWRMGSESLDEKLAEEFAELLELFGRGK
ncbi:MAG: 4-alpha-glucanotransferase [Ignavibacteriae bacterium]|nr:4-alpha-glucanotransferase [Ignavibacteriota bacterium]MCB9215490.1 4-alpha-glucanotransferase [Ignavibacteria bacterium]